MRQNTGKHFGKPQNVQNQVTTLPISDLCMIHLANYLWESVDCSLPCVSAHSFPDGTFQVTRDRVLVSTPWALDTFTWGSPGKS
jgi:hypothetical protein